MEREPLFHKFTQMDADASALLVEYYEWLQDKEGKGLTPEAASPLAHAADRYLRDFLVDIMETPAKASSASHIRCYIGNWYPINTLEPSHDDIDLIATSLLFLHQWGEGAGKIEAATLGEVANLLESTQYFHQRLEKFWALTPEEVTEWRRENDYRC
ncbi:MAG: hypothetical protein C0608_06830 [Deltaproteobacteria bacterium]|nr:MAG: hypothetical protein C0608_06830 [Deltaproteobacteria bacterium]